MAADGPIVLVSRCGLNREAAKILSGLLLVERCLEGCDAPDIDATSLLERTRRIGIEASRDVVTVGSVAVSLADHLDAVRAAMAGRIGLLPEPRPASMIVQLAERLGPAGVEIATIDADKCLQDMFAFAAGLANEVYRRVPGADTVVVSTVPEVLCLERTASVGLKTTFGGDDRDRRKACVELTLPRERLNIEGFHGLLSKTAHEVFTHVPQAWDASEQRRPYGSDCALAEGFVDAASDSLVRTAIEEMKLPGSLAPFARSFKREMDRLAGERIRRPAGGDVSFKEMNIRESRLFGRDLYETVRAAFGGGAGAHAKCIALAATLNTIDLAKPDRRTILRLMNNKLLGSAAGRSAAVDALSTFCRTRELPKLKRVLLATG